MTGNTDSHKAPHTWRRDRRNHKHGKDSNKKTEEKATKIKQMASITDTMSFVFACGVGNKILFFVGAVAAFLNGLVGPMLAVLFSVALARASTVGIDIEDIAFDDIKQVSLGLVVVGLWAFTMTFVQTVCFEIVAFRAAHSLNLQWFRSLLRQDAAFFDVYDIPGIASIIQPTCYLYRRGMGAKFGEGIQYMTTVICGVGFAFVASWKISVLVLAILPVCIGCSIYAIHLSQTRTARANKSYKHAGGIAYSTISSLRTILAFNAVPQMIEEYKEATEEAAQVSTRFLVKYGIAAGLFLSSYIVMFVAVSMYGAKLLYTDIEEVGCDPAAGMFADTACETTGASILGAFLGFLFAAEGMSQVANSFEGIVEARSAAFEALRAIKRETGAPREIIYHPIVDGKIKKRSKLPGMSDTEIESDDCSAVVIPTKSRINRLDTEDIEFLGTVGHNINCCDIIRGCREKTKKKESIESTDVEENIIRGPLENVKAILPKFEIDSADAEGKRPTNVHGRIQFKKVSFSYPTRPADRVLHNFSLDIEAGKTVAFVGPSGSGKSTIVSMIERFYDPSSGSILLDGIDLKHYSVSYLRSLIGYVGQEPTLFATTIRENIEYGCPGATEEQIIAAAKLANAHDFICEFPCGYDTHVGDKGSQLSGGQKQRIVIAQMLLSNKRVLLLDEATSALDSESELVVQNAIDNVLAQKKMTSIIIAHRLSTIRNADIIAVVVNGSIVETGTHDKLMEDRNSYYRKLVSKQEAPKRGCQLEPTSSSEDDSAAETLTKVNSYRCISPLDAPDSIELRTAVSMSQPSNIEVVYYPNQPNLDQDTPHINFKNVRFAYPARPSRLIFQNFNLSIKCGETVALVGPSGGGKSTTVAMIERYYDPSEGVLEYMGFDVRKLNPEWYRDQIGFVSQEPTLLNDTIANNIAFGNKHATKEMIIEVARKANAHDFIVGFPDGYNTHVGNRGAQLSGGQKQRIAIARALLKSPKVLILDEATSALDSESETIVQAALDKLMASREHTTIVIAHRLSTVRNADRIAYVAEGKVHETGSHEELMTMRHGRYRRLVEAQKRTSTLLSVGLLDESLSMCSSSSSDVSDNSMATKVSGELDELGTTYFNARRIWREGTHDICYIIIGSLGSIVNGAIFPAWGIMFAQTIDLLFQQVLECPSDDEVPVKGYETCNEYWLDASETMRKKSIQVGLSWTVVVIASFVGAISSKVGFGTAAERLNKRIRDSTFISLVRQEIAFFDIHSIGRILAVLQDDTTMLYAFTGEPLRMFWIGISSVAIGVVLAFIFVWPVALVSLGCIPLMGFALSLRMGKATGRDRGANDSVEQDSPSGVVVETLLNMKTVAALTLEERKFDEFKQRLHTSEPNNYWESTKTAITHGMAYLLHHWVDSLLLFFAGWLLHHYPTKFTFLEVLNSNFALYFSLFGLGVALKEIANREEIKQATSRVFYILDRKSALDPLCREGHKLD